MKVIITNSKGSFDITKLLQNIKWSGDYKQAARILNLSLTVSPTDKKVPAVDIPVGTLVQLKGNAKTDLFYGYVTSRSKSTEGNVLSLSCLDKGWYLKRNEHIDIYENETPEAITKSLAGLFNIKLGTVAKTGVKISRKFLNPTSIYDIISTAYTLASRKTGQKYHIGFKGESLNITIKQPAPKTLIIRGKSNLIAANTTESIENLTSEVAVYDTKGKLVKTFKDDERIKLYGKLRKVIKQSEKENKFTEAESELKDNGVEQKITVDSLGDLSCVAGGCVIVQESYTGIYGLFYIDSDVHEWKKGQYYNKLVLNFKKLMNEKEVGEVIKKK